MSLDSVTLDRPRSGTHQEIEVAVLGPTEVRGVASFSRSSALDLVVYLALHPDGVANDVWATALWPERVMAPATLYSTASAARRALGRSGFGLDHLPRSHSRLRLANTVTTDWRRFEVLAASRDPKLLRAALKLVRGRPFEGLRNAEWTILDGTAALIEERVTEVACAVADEFLEHGDCRSAAVAARRGLLVSPYDERLYRRLLLCADGEGHPAGVERVMTELLTRLEGVVPRTAVGTFDLAVVHPETASLYGRLSRRRQPQTGAHAATN